MSWLRRAAPVLLMAVLIVGCGSDNRSDDESATGDGSTTEPTTAGDSTTTVSTVPLDPATMAPAELAELACQAGGEGFEGHELGRIQNATLVETSGLFASSLNPGVLWANNDSGGEPVVYAVGPDGSDLGAWDVTGADARDWEELAGWHDVDNDRHYLFLADIGDNSSQRDSVTIYRVAEPTVGDGGGGATGRASAYELVYPDGAHDAEVFFVDPATGDWFIITKGWGTGISRVFRTTEPRAGGTTTLDDTGTSVNLKDLGSYATAGDANGIVVLRTYEEVAVWPLEGSVGDALATEPCVGPSADEAQGEAVAIAPDRTGYYTVSEGANAPLYWFPFLP